MRRLIAASIIASVLCGCASAAQPQGACPDFITVLNLTLINPTASAINVPDNQTGITVQGAIGGTSAQVTLTPISGGPQLTAVTNPLFPIPQPGPTQYNLVLPALAAHTTYSVTVISSQPSGGCPFPSSGSPGSFTTV